MIFQTEINEFKKILQKPYMKLVFTMVAIIFVVLSYLAFDVTFGKYSTIKLQVNIYKNYLLKINHA